MAAAREHPAPAEDWLVLRGSRRPANTLAGHLDLALRREGVDLAVLNALFQVVPPAELATIIRSAPTGAHTWRLWFLYEWLTERTLDVPDPGKVRAVPVVDPKQQPALRKGEPSPRHRVLDNLPGTPAFCPMVRWTALLSRLAAKELHVQARRVIGRTHPDVVARAAAFMRLSGSRSSFATPCTVTTRTCLPQAWRGRRSRREPRSSINGGGPPTHTHGRGDRGTAVRRRAWVRLDQKPKR